MKFAWPESQKRLSLKWGNIDWGSPLAGESGGSLGFAGGESALGKVASGCCAYAGMLHVAAATSHGTASSSVTAVQPADLRSCFRIFPTSHPRSIHTAG